MTKVVERFEDPDVPVTLYDTKGVELGDSKRRVIRDYKRLIAAKRKGRPEEHIHVLWYCMDAGQTRVEDYDLEIMAELAAEIPVILVFTQVIDDERADGLEARRAGRRARRRQGRADARAAAHDRHARPSRCAGWRSSCN